MYGSEWGRFLSPDPIGLASARKTSPKSLNRYSYTEGNPVNYVDRGGKYIESPDSIYGSPDWLCRSMGMFCESPLPDPVPEPAPPQDPIRIPFLTLLQLGGRMPEVGNCGASQRRITWQVYDLLGGAAAANYTGAVVQHTTGDYTFNSNGSSTYNPVDFFEAWTLENGNWTGINSNGENYYGIDAFVLKGTQGTNTSTSVTTNAKFIEGQDIINIVKGWGTKVSASGLYSLDNGTSDPAKQFRKTWTDSDTIQREWKAHVNCGPGGDQITHEDSYKQSYHP